MLSKRAFQILIAIFMLLIVAAAMILLLPKADVGGVTNAKLVTNPIHKEQIYE